MTVLNIGLLWHSVDSPNLGVGALSYAQMHLVSQAAAAAGVVVTFTMIGWNREDVAPPDPRILQVCQVNGKRLLGLKPELHDALKKCDLVLDIGEGDSFSDIYGWKRLVFLIATKLLACRGGKRLVLSPQTLGPFRSRLAIKLSDFAMSRARAVCSRDQLSTAYLHSRRLNVPSYEAIDVAFALPFERQRKTTTRTLIGLNVSGLLWAGGYSGKNQFGLQLDYQATVLALIDHFTALPDVDVVLVPHVVTANRQAEDDLRASQKIVALRPLVQIAGPFSTPMAAKSYISSMDFFIGARMHACIAAFSSGVPCVPMAYSRKFSGLFNTLGYAHVADCTQENQAQVVSRVTTSFQQRAQLTKETQTGNELAQQRLIGYRNLLVELLRETSRG